VNSATAKAADKSKQKSSHRSSAQTKPSTTSKVAASHLSAFYSAGTTAGLITPVNVRIAGAGIISRMEDEQTLEAEPKATTPANLETENLQTKLIQREPSTQGRTSDLTEETDPSQPPEVQTELEETEPDESAVQPKLLQREEGEENDLEPQLLDEQQTDQQGSIQPKIAVGAPNDKYEQEADHVSDTVMRMPLSAPRKTEGTIAQTKVDTTSSIRRLCSECGKKIQAEQGDEAETMQRMCANCDDEVKQTNGEEINLQAKPNGPTPLARSNKAAKLVYSPGPGTPLAKNIRSRVEPVLNADLNHVRVHSDSRANEATKSIKAKAFTHKNNIFLGPGQSANDLSLMSHESTHVVQQTPMAQRKPLETTGDEVEEVPEEQDRLQTRLEVNARREFEPPMEGVTEVEAVVGRSAGGEKESVEGAGAEVEGEAGVEAETSEGETESEGKTGVAEGRASEAGSAAEGTSVTTDSERANDEGGGGAVPESAGGPGEGSASGAGPETGDGARGDDHEAGGAGGSDSAGPQPGGAGGPGGGGGTAVANTGGQGRCTGSTAAECFDEDSEDPAEEPSERPPNPEATRVNEETSEGDEEDLPEVDDCSQQEVSSATAETAQSTGELGTAEAPAPVEQTAPEGGEEAGVATEGAEGEGAGGAGGGAGAAEGGGPSPEAGVAQGEGQRNDAVAGYSSSTAELLDTANGIPALRTGTEFANSPGNVDPINRREARQRMDRFFTNAARRLDQAVEFASQAAPDQLGSQAEAAKADISASMVSQKSAISARIQIARRQARADAAMARQEVNAQTETFIGTIETETAGAIESLTDAHTDGLGEVDSLETSTLATINTIYSDGRTQLEGLGNTVGDECTSIGATYASTYEGFSNCTENGFWDGNLSQRRAAAQADAARSVAEGYHDRMVEAARKRAREVTRNGRKEDRCAVINSAITSRDTLRQTLANLTSAMESSRDTSIEQAQGTRDSIISNIDSSLTITLRQLGQQEHDQRQAVNNTGYMQQLIQEQLAHAGATSIQRIVTQIGNSVEDGLLDLKAQFAAIEPPDADMLDQAIGEVTQRIDGAFATLQSRIQGGTDRAGGELANALQTSLSSLTDITQGNDEQAGSLSEGFLLSMSQIAGTDHFATQRVGFMQQVQTSASEGITSLKQAVDSMLRGCDTTMDGARVKVRQAAEGLEQNLRQSKQGIECEIAGKAYEAASKEAPAWKRLVAVLLIILVVVIIIAVIVASGGTALAALAAAVGPIAAGMIVGAAVGAVIAGLTTAASNLWNNRDVTTGLLSAIAWGALTGLVGGGLGAWVGGLVKGAAVGWQVAAELVSAAGLDVVFQFLQGGLSFEIFSWKGLGLGLIITLVTFGAGRGIARARAGRAGTADAGRSNGTTRPDAPETAPRPNAPESTTPTPEPTIGFGRTPRTPTTPTPEPTIGFGRTPRAPTTPTPEPSIGFGRTPRAPTTPTPEPTIGFGRTPRAPTTPTPEPTIGFGRTPRTPIAPASAGSSGPTSSAAHGRPVRAAQVQEPQITPGRTGGPTRRPVMAGGGDDNAPAMMAGDRGGPGAPRSPRSTPRPDAPEQTTQRPDAPEPTAPRPDTPEPTAPRPDAPEPTSPRPWEQGGQPTRYQRYVKNLQRRNARRAQQGKSPREPLGPEEWWNRHGSKAPNNPHGGEGNLSHRAVADQLVARARATYPPPRYQVRSNQGIPGTSRRPDAAVIDTHTGKVVRVYEAARFNRSGGFVRQSEAAKIPDYEAAGIPYEFHPVGPNQPPGGVVTSN
jgi:hypothetical protein